MSRDRAIAHAERYFDEGGFFADLARRVAIPTESQNPERGADLAALPQRRNAAQLRAARLQVPDPRQTRCPSTVRSCSPNASKIPSLVTVLSYGHGDVIRGQEQSWKAGLDPWKLTRDGDRLYGRGTADNKGQHSINLGAVAAAIAARGRLGFNLKVLIETGEEVGSPGLKQFCSRKQDLLKADVLIASDGPRLQPGQPTMFLGSRGAFNMDLVVDLREGGHHSGNWGGLLANPGIILAHALASITGPKGEIKVKEWRPDSLTPSVREALAGLEVDGGADGPKVDAGLGRAGPHARRARVRLVELRSAGLHHGQSRQAGQRHSAARELPLPAALRGRRGSRRHRAGAAERHLADAGFPMVKVTAAREGFFPATRLDPRHPWVVWVKKSLEKTSRKPTAILPNLGGSLPNDVFSDDLGLPTVWIPHSYASCSQHAPNEHMLAPVARDALRLMAGLMWDLGEAASLPRV